MIPTTGDPSSRPRLKQIIEKIQSQSYKILEVIIVWQGERAPQFTASLPDIVNIQYEQIRAVSRARNVGASLANGDLIWFIDDDTIPESEETLEKAMSVLEDQHLDFIIANIVCHGENKASESIAQDVAINKNTLRGRFSEPGLLIYKKLYDIHSFDDSLGVGCIHGSSEGFDLGARLIGDGRLGIKRHNYILYHPDLADDDQTNINRIFYYSLGNGYVLVKNGYYYWYLYEFLRVGFWLFQGIIRWDKQKIKSSIVRCLCLILGPLIPPRSPS